MPRTPELALAIVSTRPFMFTAHERNFFQVIGNAISFCLFGALTVQLCASPPTHTAK